MPYLYNGNVVLPFIMIKTPKHTLKYENHHIHDHEKIKCVPKVIRSLAELEINHRWLKTKKKTIIIKRA